MENEITLRNEVLKLGDELGDTVEEINSCFRILELLTDEIFEDILFSPKPDFETYKKRYDTCVIKSVAVLEYEEKMSNLLKQAREQAQKISLYNIKKLKEELKQCQD